MADFIDAKDLTRDDKAVPLARRELYEEAEQAFVTLGYTKAMAHKVIAMLVKEDPDMSVNDIIRRGLQML